MSAPFFSVLLPVYNGADYLQDAVRSILSQSHTDFELLAIDDGSTDASLDLLYSFDDPRIRVLRNPRNIGLASTLNRGLQEACGEWVARQDADDVSLQERLRLQAKFLRETKNVAVLGTGIWPIDNYGRISKYISKPCSSDAIRWELVFDNPLTHSTVVLHRKTVLQKYGGYDVNIRYGEDWDLWSRMVSGGERIVNLRNKLVLYRTHGNSMTASARDITFGESMRLTANNARSILGIEDWRKKEIEGIIDVALTLRFREPYGDPSHWAANLLAHAKRYASKCGQVARREIMKSVAKKLLALGEVMLRIRRIQCLGLFARAVCYSPEVIAESQSHRVAGLMDAGIRARRQVSSARQVDVGDQ